MLGANLAEKLPVLGFVRVRRCGGSTEKMRLEWPWLVLLYPPHSLPTHVLVASSYTRTWCGLGSGGQRHG